jgi:two-component system cell cycle response regulator DivK
MTILYIEDNPQNIRLVRKMLSVGGYTMQEAFDGLSGVQKAQEAMPELILLDINLPDIDGIEATRRLKHDPQTQHIPVIALTTHVVSGDREQFLEAGCDGYLAKPIGKNELLSTVARLLTQQPDQRTGTDVGA